MSACTAAIDAQLSPYTSYVIVRGDLPMGLMVANTIHAVAESTPTRLPPESIAVALAARDESHLRELSALLGVRGIKHHMVVETDGPHASQAMAIGIEPTRDRAAIRKAVSGLPLVR